MPLISIIVPVYNVENYIRKCADSILNQTWKEFELILVDDGATDQSGMICDEMAKESPMVSVIHKTNGGLSDARNVGIEHASGEYLMFIDSDDWIDCDMIELLYRVISKYQADIAECSFRNIYTNRIEEETSCSGQIICGDGVDGIQGILNWNYFKPVAWNKLYKKSLFDEIRYPVGRCHEDEFTTYKVFYKAKKIVYCDVSKYNYVRQREGSIVSSYTEKNLDICFAMRERRTFIKEHALDSIAEKANDIYCWIMFHNLAKSEKYQIKGEKYEKVLNLLCDDLEYYREEGLRKDYFHLLELIHENQTEEFVRQWLLLTNDIL